MIGDPNHSDSSSHEYSDRGHGPQRESTDSTNAVSTGATTPNSNTDTNEKTRQQGSDHAPSSSIHKQLW